MWEKSSGSFNFEANQSMLMIYKGILILFFVLSGTWVMAQTIQVIPGHAHNDYAVNQPLTDALKQGFMSVEADVHLIAGELYVAHDHPDTANTSTLRQLYLDPLAKIVSENKGSVYPDYKGPFFLMIDFKTPGPETWKVLKEQLLAYQEILHTPHHTGPVTVVISGNRPVEQISREKERLASIDGRPSELEQGYNSSLMPVISENFNKIVQWNGEGEIPEQELAVIQALADQTHAEGKLLRLWAIPDHPKAWSTLLKADVDLINTDKIEAFQDFYH